MKILLIVCLGLICQANAYLRDSLGRRRYDPRSACRPIIDGAGYSLHNDAYSLDLAMQANQPVDQTQLGIVTLEPYTNGRDQKWGTSFYGTNEVALSNGLFGRNNVSIYYPEGSSRDRARLYKVESLCEPNLYKITNQETGMCLVANPGSNDDGGVQVEFGSCSAGNYRWVLRRTG